MFMHPMKLEQTLVLKPQQMELELNRMCDADSTSRHV